ncbi:phosphate regulon transcriptional regulator PhoB [Alkalimonas amylolytica]|uniref:Phosphate regulon transcriptional regulatory protein PhoB n=1 Tax=Alkalimonas amylolytica TaxID=152573 RepID=A0A1H4E1K6_ALKAM|nr:phosphate regulon transcriptional regulator PhoB [Alkalimonas amylolytica]SEA78905.1 two-component system, OmpR family, phosphate regulon response regulator PhoB [Alkalimonas amylolytica]
MSRRVLVVEDEAPIRDMLCFVLEQNGYQTSTAEDVDQALESLIEPYPDLVLLDWMLPGGSGIQIAKKMKQHELTRQIPIIMITARGEEEDKVKGLEVGADDYVTKPFSPKELMARIKAVIRRVSPTSLDDVIEVQGLKLDPVSHRVSAKEEALDMGPTEFRLLHFFMTHPERVYSREQLLDHVWGTNVYVEDRTVDVHIRRLRKAISPAGHDRLIQTVRGSGYRFSLK